MFVRAMVYTEEQLELEEEDASITARNEVLRIGVEPDTPTNSAINAVIPAKHGVATSQQALPDTLTVPQGAIPCRQRKGVAHLGHAWYGQAQQNNVGHSLPVCAIACPRLMRIGPQMPCYHSLQWCLQKTL
jgi:hypothetical protein